MAKREQKEHQVRRNELLDVAQGLFVQQGYDATPVSAVLVAAGIAKGTFYHYFNSKEDLLDALVERMIEQILAGMRATISQPGLGATEKLTEYFNASARWKAENWDALIAVIKPLYSNHNLLLRHKMNRRTMEMGVPDLEAIIEEGVKEGVFDTPDPREAAEMVLGMGFAHQESNAELFFSMNEKPENWDLLVRKMGFFQDAVERLLGAPAGSLHWLDEESLKAFRPDKER